jgi:HD-GYP domain-containing protein (c-di-GMP phosphodiesterase class II)
MKENEETYRAFLARLSALVAEREEPEELLDTILEGLRDAAGAIEAELLLYHSEMNLLYPRKAAGLTESWGLSAPKRSLANKALEELKTQYIPDVRDSGYQSPFPGARALLSVPIIVAGRMHGVLNLGVPRVDGITQEDITWIDIIAAFLGGLLEVVHLREVAFDLHRQLIDNMSAAVGEKDPTYGGHADRVSAYAVAIANQMDLPKRVVDDVERSGFLHDIGKIGVSPGILTKPGKLTDDEFTEVKKHAILGRFLLKPLGFMPGVLEGIATHHERWDGDGYPRGLKGEEIPIEGRILAVAEALDTMTTDQPYRKALPLVDALAEIRDQSGRQFDPDVVSALCSALDAGLDVARESD